MMAHHNIGSRFMTAAIAATCGLGAWLASPPAAEAQGLFRSQSGSICEQAGDAELKPIRRTLVYVDQQSLSLDQSGQGWFDSLNQMLQQTMSTAEPLEIIVLNSAEGTARRHGETLCYPVIDERYQERFRSSGISSLLTNDLIDQLPKLQQEMVRQMQDQVGPAYAHAPEQLTRRTPSQVGERHLLRALQADAARFGDDTPTRVIIYSDMIENSSVAELESILEASREEMVELASQAAEQLPRLDFQGAMVYGYGTGHSLEDPAAADALSSFMQQVVYLANGHPGNVSRELAVRPVRPANSQRYDTVVTVDDQPYRGRMHLLSDESGRLTDSYLDLGVGNRSAHFASGRLVCSDSNDCQLEGTLATTLVFEDPENVFLEGQLTALEGHLGFRNDRLRDSENPALVPLTASGRQ